MSEISQAWRPNRLRRGVDAVGHSLCRNPCTQKTESAWNLLPAQRSSPSSFNHIVLTWFYHIVSTCSAHYHDIWNILKRSDVFGPGAASCPWIVPEAYPLRKHSWNQGLSLGSHGSPFINLTSSTAQGGGGSFKKRKPIGEVGCCESGMAKRTHWWTERCLRSPLLSLSFSDYLLTYQPIFYVSSIDLSLSFI